ncbi:DUF3800 domain-containing protein [Bacillus thuringiensis]|uniref:DUF3800 domain-containing protein n=1 Tax=Bacillus thuringiensis TaxID=1428 RepID=UPI000E486F25|nr:DUF3800 domain-containing protein [Bacillus thuringiensis]MDZ3954837.1 DUF3800 domain-containing protein [Bacillus thuringiensis]RGP44436.1 hypothetical protein BTW32_27340 [Bacillus thuringiensis]
MEATFYIDESGNTGTDWLNDKQPFFTYGGWLVLNEKQDLVENFLNGFIGKEQADELKSKNVFKRTGGLKLFANIYNKLLHDFSAVPFFIVADKKFMVAAKIVETFFDCVHNPYVNAYLTHPVELKKALANCIFEHKDDKVLDSFAVFIKRGTIPVESLREINLSLISIFEKEGHKQVANTLKNLTEENFLSMINEFQTVTTNGNLKNRITLTVTMLLEILRNIEIYSNNRNISVRVSHDSLRGYEGLFQEVADIYFREESPFIYKNNGVKWLSNFPHIKSIAVKNSVDEPCIQASDLICGFASNCFNLISQMNDLEKLEKGLLKSLVIERDFYVEENVILWNWYAPYDFKRKFISSMNPEVEIQVADYHMIIERDFEMAIKNNVVN